MTRRALRWPAGRTAAAGGGRAPGRSRRTLGGVLLLAPLAGTLAAVAAGALAQAPGALAQEERLRAVAAAQERHLAAHGRYADDLAALEAPGGRGAESTRDTDGIVVLRADADGYCVAAWHAASRTLRYLDQDRRIGTTSCG